MSRYGRTPTELELPLTHDNFFKKLEEYTSGVPDDDKAREKKELAPLLTFVNGKDFMEKEFPKQTWLIEDLIPEQGLVCLSGMPSSYKSWFGFYISLCVLKGIPVLDRWDTVKGGVLFIDKENIEDKIQERMKMLGAGPEMENCYFTQGNFTTENLQSLAAVVSFVKEKGIKLVIIDSLIRIHTRNENEAVEMNKVFERLAEIQHAGAAVLYLHHLRKATTFTTEPMERLRGSIDISARLDSLLAVENDKNLITVVHGKSRYVQAIDSFVMEFAVGKEGLAFFNYVREADSGQLQELVCEDAILSILREGTVTKKTILDQLSTKNGGSYSTRTLERALSTLVAQSKIIRYMTGGSARYSLNKLTTFIQEKEAE